MRMYEHTIAKIHQPARKRHKVCRSHLAPKRHANLIQQPDSEEEDVVILSPSSPTQSPPPSPLPSRSGRVQSRLSLSKRSNVDSFRRTSSSLSLASMVRRSVKDKALLSKVQAQAGPQVSASSSKSSTLASMNAARKASIPRVNHNPITLGKSRAKKRSAGSQSGV